MKARILVLLLCGLGLGPVRSLKAVTFSGHVYEGQVGSVKPLIGVTINLYGANDSGVLGQYLNATQTSSTGAFALTVAPVFEYYTLIETDPSGYYSVGAISGGGTVVSMNQILYTSLEKPLDAQVLSGNVFWDLPVVLVDSGVISGFKYHDLNGNGQWDGPFEPGGEPALPGWVIELDADQDGRADQSQTTNVSGYFSFTELPAGTYTVGEQQQTGWMQTDPGQSGPHVIGLSQGESVQVLFGNRKIPPSDYGDAPPSYGSAWHEIGGVTLGSRVDAEDHMLHSADAQGDDQDGQDDEDGVDFLTDLVRGQDALIHIGVVYYVPGHADVWIDFNQDGVFQEIEEKITFTGGNIQGSGANFDINGLFPIPANAKLGPTFLRARIVASSSPGGSLLPTGPAGVGEVEDYQVTIQSEGQVLPPGQLIGGLKWNDLNGNGQQDPGEPGLGGWTFWLDANQNGVRDPGDPETLSNPDGTFYFAGLPVGDYRVGEEHQVGWVQTYPGGDGTQTVRIQPGLMTSSLRFGNRRMDVNDSNGTPTEPPHVIWSEPPVEIDPNLCLDPNLQSPPLYLGWSEGAWSWQEPGTQRHWRFSADDFHCLGPQPITRVYWWGAYRDWRQADLPQNRPTAWQIAFWSDVPQPEEWSDLYPEKPIWVVEVPTSQVTEVHQGRAEFPGLLSDDLFAYQVTLSPAQWFYPYEQVSEKHHFWISITALYPDGMITNYPWGWKTRPQSWGEAAYSFVTDANGIDPAFYLDPTEHLLASARGALCDVDQPYDLCFELLTEDPWSHADQPFTGLRHWPHYAGQVSLGWENDRREIELIARAIDDWTYEKAGPVTGVTWWGTYPGYAIDANACEALRVEPRRPDYFEISLWTGGGAADRLGQQLWSYRAFDFDEVYVGVDRHPFVGPNDCTPTVDGPCFCWEPNEPIYRYSVRVPRQHGFTPPDINETYWLSILAVYQDLDPEIPYEWAWLNHPHQAHSAAFGIDYRSAASPRWQPLTDDRQRPVDLSFALFTTPEAFVPLPELTSWWRFNEIYSDVAVDSIDAPNGQVVGAGRGIGREGSALDFFNEGQFLELGTSDRFTPESLTLMMWVRPERSEGEQWIVSRSSSNEAVDYSVMLNRRGQLQATLGQDRAEPLILAFDEEIPQDEWTHLTLIRENREARLIINGERAVGARLHPGIFRRYPLTAGSPRKGSRPFLGLLDDLRFYDVALSDEAVRDLVEEAPKGSRF